MINITIKGSCPIPCPLHYRSALRLLRHQPERWLEALDQLGQMHLPLVTVPELRERRFPNGYCCPHCQSRHIHRHGRYRNRQRYRCVDCGRTFNDWTGSPLHGTHYPEKWTQFIGHECAGHSLRFTAAALGVSVTTVFAWRHKLLAGLVAGLTTSPLGGIVELDDLHVLEAQKGARHLAREPRRRGTGHFVSRWRRSDGPRFCMVLAQDRRNRRAGTVLGPGPLQVHALEAALDQLAVQPQALCVDNHQAYWSFARRRHVPHYRLLHPGQAEHGLYHLRHVDRLETRFMRWIRRFHGVSTRYLGHYLAWFLFHDRESRAGLGARGLARQLLLEAFSLPVGKG